MANSKKLFRGGKYLGILLTLLITAESAEISSEKSVSIPNLIDDTTVNILEVSNGTTVESNSDSNESEGLETETANTDTETDSHTFLQYSAYVIGWIFAVILVFIAAATLFCFLTAAASMTYWIYKGSRRLIRRCCCTKENDLENCPSSFDGNWILREASSMKPF